MSLLVIDAILVAVSALPVTLPVNPPVNVPAIAPVPVIVGLVNVLFVRVWVAVNWTMSLLVIDAILVAVSALPVKAPVTSPEKFVVVSVFDAAS